MEIPIINLFSLEIVNLFSQNLFALGALNQEEGCIPKAKVDILPAVRQNRIFICQRSNSCISYNSCKPMITSFVLNELIMNCQLEAAVSDIKV